MISLLFLVVLGQDSNFSEALSGPLLLPGEMTKLCTAPSSSSLFRHRKKLVATKFTSEADLVLSEREKPKTKKELARFRFLERNGGFSQTWNNIHFSFSFFLICGLRNLTPQLFRRCAYIPGGSLGLPRRRLSWVLAISLKLVVITPAVCLS